MFEDEVLNLTNELPKWYAFLMMPFSVLISWDLVTMEVIGDNGEDSFEGRFNDVPMTVLCRTIDIDLQEMLEETELPESIQPKDTILY